MTDERRPRPAGPSPRALAPVIVALLATTLLGLAGARVSAAEAALQPPAGSETYRLQAGDIVAISVWKETELRVEVLVRPDGALSFPLVGEVAAAGRSIQEVREEITERLAPFVPAPVVTVAIKAIGGNRIYVMGKVNRPGEFPFIGQIDVMQALSLAGGTTTYAALNDIVILRRDNGQAKAIRFRYGKVARGRDLQQNILLRSGDTVVVP